MNLHYQKSLACSINSAGASRLFGQLQDCAFVAGKDSADSVRRRVIERDIPLCRVVFFVVRENQALASWDALARALLRSIRLLIIDDLEFLLPPEQRNRFSLLHLMGHIREFTAKRGIELAVTSCIDLSCGSFHRGAK